MALLAFEKAPFSAIFSLSVEMSSNQVNVAPETAPMARSLRAQDLNRGWRKRSATGPSEKAPTIANKRHFAAEVTRGRGDAGDGVRRPAADRPDGSRPRREMPRRLTSELQLVQRPPGEDGLYRSTVFPGLWLDPLALLNGDRQRLRAVIDLGCATPEYTEFVARLHAARTAP